MVLEKTLESPLDYKEIKLVNPKGNQSWIFIGRSEAEAEDPILWPLDAKRWLTGKTLILEKIEGRRIKGWQKIRWLDGIIDSMDMSLSKLHKIVKGRLAWHAAIHGVTKSQTWLSHLITTTNIFLKLIPIIFLTVWYSDIFQYWKNTHLSNNSLFMVFSFSSEIILYTWGFKIRCV